MKKTTSAIIAIITLAAAIGAEAATAKKVRAQTPSAVPAAGAATAAGDAVRGKTLFTQRCGICHSTDPAEAMQGPSLGGLIGRKSGGESHFAGYSKALTAAAITWSPATLDGFLEAPTKVVPGTMMVIASAQPNDRADLIAYLATVK